MPYKHYSADVIEAAIARSEGGGLDGDSCPADESTVQRWVNQFNKRGPGAAGRLQAILFEIFMVYISTLEFQGTGLLYQLARLIRAFPIPENRGTISSANFILTRYNSGFL